uniref:PLAT domain-containing protein n=1 Tax=Oryza brachyantha TaxID=4533 RepID=J3MCJ2_ORYBR
MATPSPAPPKILLFFLLLALAVAVQCSTSSELDVGGGGNVDYDCVYTVFVRTGSAWKGGTDSAIGVEFAGADGRGQLFTVEQWLATDASPYRLTAVRDRCRSAGNSAAA